MLRGGESVLEGRGDGESELKGTDEEIGGGRDD